MSCPHQSCAGCDRCTRVVVTAVCSTWRRLVLAGGDPREEIVCLDEECPLHKVVVQ